MFTLLLLLSGILERSYCFTPRIIGGHDATINDYPYQVSIHYMGKLQCGGSIINENWILTAAHCFPEIGMYPPDYQIRLRSTFKSKEGSMISGIKTIIRHKSYNSKTHDYDVALIKLPSPIEFSSSAKPIALANPATVIQTGEYAVVTGWGLLSVNGKLSENLQALEVPIMEQATCQKIFAGVNAPVTKNMLCAGHLKGGKDTCQGDSGGPLVYHGVQIGIVSWGYRCATPKYPGVYTRISEVRSWIKENANV